MVRLIRRLVGVFDQHDAYLVLAGLIMSVALLWFALVLGLAVRLFGLASGLFGG